MRVPLPIGRRLLPAGLLPPTGATRLFLLLATLGCGAGLTPPTLEGVPARTDALTLELRGRALGASEVEVEVSGAEAPLSAPVAPDGRFRLEVPLLPDVRNRLRVSARSGDELSLPALAAVDQVLRSGPRPTAGPAAPDLDPLPTSVPGGTVRVSGQAAPGASVWITTPLELAVAPVDSAGRFAREVAVRPGVESWIVAWVRDALGAASDAVLATVLSEGAGEPAIDPAPPALDAGPLVSWRTALTLSGQAPGATHVTVEGGAFPASGPVAADGRFAVGVALHPGRENVLSVRAAAGSRESAAVVWRVRQTGAGAARWPLVLVPGPLSLRGGLGAEALSRVASALEARGFEAYVADLPQGSSARRAAGLHDALARLTSGKVNLIAHSVAGLDARLAIARLGLGARVASLTTIATPHRGTPLADVALKLLSGPSEAALDFLVHEVGCDPDCARGLTVSFMRSEFNAQVPDDPRVAYFSWGGRAAPGAGLSPGLWLPGGVVRAYEGENDGLVSSESARWGQWRGALPMDHAGEARAGSESLFLQVAQELAARGY